MFILILKILAGIFLVLTGANWLVDGSSSIARKTGLSEFLIGLTIVGIGTSTPEMVVSFISAINGNSDMALGNIVGSNIFNVYFTLGVTALIVPIAYTKSNLRWDIPLSFFVTLLLVFLCYDTIFNRTATNTLSRLDGIILLTLFAGYMIYSFRSSKKSKQNIPDTNSADKNKYVALSWKERSATAIILIIIGLAALIFGGDIFINSAVELAKVAGLSDSFIAITLLAGGTSLPELATSVVAVLKKRGQMALGNIIGSNIANILLILGGSAVIMPLTLGGITFVDMMVMLSTSLLLSISAYTFRKKRLDKPEGVIFVLIYIGYIFWLAKNLV